VTEEVTLKTVLEVWRSVLGTESGPDEVFYQLGGTSLTAAQMAARLQAVTGRRVPMRIVLRDAMTARQLARWMDNSARAEGGDARPLLLDAAVEAEDTEPAPITVQQEAIWFLEQLDPQNVAYNTLSAVWLAGPLQIKVLKEALAEPIRRHPLLRATFPTRDGWPVQLIHSADEAAPVL
jgi:nonribosomal peptide synthetase DhbF